jgi:hypothetical protein
VEVVPVDLPSPAAVLDAFGRKVDEAQNCGMPLTSVAGGLRKLGSWPASPGSCGPGSVNALGLVTLTAPSGGRSGLPKPLAARAAAVRAANPPAASIARRERFALIISLVISTHASKDCFGVSFMTRDYQFHSLPQSSKVWPPSVDPTSNPASARGRYRYSLLFYFQVATPTIPNAKIDLAGLRGMIDSVGRFEGSVPGDRWRSQRESDLAASGYVPAHVRPF